jgi:sugar lactone lactonase YvrE
MTIESHDAAMRRIAPEDVPLELIQDGFEFLEGPVWDRRDGVLLFSDIPRSTIYRYTPGQGVTEFRQPSGYANGNTIAPDGSLLTCEHAGRRVSRRTRDGDVTALATHYDGKKLNSPNDLVRHSSGAIYFTDPPYGLSPPHGVEAEKELDFHGVYRLDPDGTVTLLVDDFDRPNGLAFSPDERLLYIDDTARSHIRVFTLTPDGGLTDDRLFVELQGDGRGRPDGMKLDREGNIYCTGPGGVWVVNPNGEVLGRIRVPEQTANLGWGDADWQSLYLTAMDKLYRVRLALPGIPVG